MLKIMEVILPFFSEVLNIRKKTKRKLEKHVPYIKIIGFLLIGVLLITCWYLASFSVKSSLMVYKQRNAMAQATHYKQDLVVAHKVNLALIDIIQATASQKVSNTVLVNAEVKITLLLNELEEETSALANKPKAHPSIQESIKVTGEAVRADEASSAAAQTSTPTPGKSRSSPKAAAPAAAGSASVQSKAVSQAKRDERRARLRQNAEQ